MPAVFQVAGEARSRALHGQDSAILLAFMSISRLAGASGIVLTFLSGCPKPSVCNVQSCPLGCCEGDVCRNGNAHDTCGSGGSLCDVCVGSQTCLLNRCVSPPAGGGGGEDSGAGGDAGVCTPEPDSELCAAAGRNCGFFSTKDRCGTNRMPSCGVCVGMTQCDWGVCICAPESDAAFCQRHGKNCFPFTATDNCGSIRTVPSCGRCAPHDPCGSRIPNVCCISETPAEFCGSRSGCDNVSGFDRNCGHGRIVGCGLSCSGGRTCNVSVSQCQCAPGFIFDGGTCVCYPNCGGKNCGPDGCGGNCGICSGSDLCVSGTCQACQPSCQGKNCGPDGCGGSCGICQSSQMCSSAGTCLVCDPVQQIGCAATERCRWSSSGVACTSVVGTGVQGTQCTSDSSCGRGTLCAVVSGSQNCREYCYRDADCSTGGKCAFPLANSLGVCSTPCDPLATTVQCGIGEHCYVFSVVNGPSQVTDCQREGARGSGSPCTTVSDCFSDACVGQICRDVCRIGTTGCGARTCTAVAGWSTYGVCI